MRPEVRLLDARERGLDERGLRAWARAETAACEAAHTTRAYRHPYCLIAWHNEPIGVDIERIEPCDAAFVESICTPTELARSNGSLDVDADVHYTSIWCSKEALSKALGDSLRYDPRRLDSPLEWPGGQSGPWRAEALDLAPPGHTAWLCWRAAGNRHRV